MKVMQLMNRQREVVGQISWDAPGNLEIAIEDADLAAGVNAFLDQAREKGLTLRSGGQVEHEGKTLFMDTLEQVPVNDERFLRSLADVISRENFGGQRLFGLIKEEEMRHVDA